MFRKYVFLSVVMVMILGLLGCGGGAPVEEVAVPTVEEVAVAAEGHYVQAHNLHREGRYGEAIEEYNKAIELNPNYAIAYAERGQAYFELGQYDLAIPDLAKAIELDPNLAGSTTTEE